MSYNPGRSYNRSRGKKPEVIIQGNLINGDNINISGNSGVTNVNFKSTLDNVTQEITQKITDSPSINQPTKDELNDLIKQLNDTLQKAPEQKREEAEAVTDAAKTLVDAATKEKPNKKTVEITAEGLLKAAENIAKVMPTVLIIAKQIVAALLI
jgi:hypothetical protein